MIAALTAFSVPASADSDGGRFEASGFVGVDYFGDETGLGGSPAPEQRPQTAPTFGGRLTFIAASVGRDLHLDFGVEADASFTASWTGYGFDGPRQSYFAPVLGYHGNLLLRLGGAWIQPHLTVGGGGETVISDSPFMAKETDAVFLWGAGATFPMGDRWLLRFDGRQGTMESMDGSATHTYEAFMSVGTRLGVKPKPAVRETVEVVTAPPIKLPGVDRDSDADGLMDAIDACPRQPETVNNFEDQDGCPETDRDGDGLADGADQCPDRAEDFDSFEDEDGCADDDNDKDGIPDLRDRCPLEAESKNGIADEDGCVDEVPAEIITALAAARAVKFETGRARLSKAAKAALDKALVVALNNKSLKLTVSVHAQADDPAGVALAQKRLAVITFYLTEQGVSMGNLTGQVRPALPDKKAPLVELAVTQ